MTIRETSDVLGLKVRTVRKWVKNGVLVAEKKGKCWDISEDDVNREEIRNRADKSREHSRRIKEGRSMGMCEQDRQDPEKSVQRKKRTSK